MHLARYGLFQKAQSMMDNSPDTVDKHQLDELHIQLKKNIKDQLQ